MLCDNCVNDLLRDVVRRTGVPVNCLAFCCLNHDENWKSRCNKEEVAKKIFEWSVPNPDKMAKKR